MRDDLCIRFLPFPNRAARAAVMPNAEGSYDILVNTLYPEETQRRALEHELEHLRREHLDRGESVWLQEAEARGEEAEWRSICCYTPAGILEEFIPAASRADFALVVPGQGMKPHYRQGQLLFCRDRQPRWNGDAAVFLIGGRAELRQVYRDPFGCRYLLNSNRACAGEDLILPTGSDAPPLLGTPLKRKRLPPVQI